MHGKYTNNRPFRSMRVRFTSSALAPRCHQMSQFIHMEITMLEQSHNRDLKREESDTQELLLGVLLLESWTCLREGMLGAHVVYL